MSRTFVALGGNLGETARRFDAALDALRRSDFRLVARSDNYRSGAMGAEAGDFYLNAVAEFDSELPPPEQLAWLHEIEARFGRERNTVWGPRTLDLDLLYCDDQRIHSATLTLPHPHAWYRRFVLQPMCDLAAEFVHPDWGRTQRELLDVIDLRPLPVWWIGPAFPTISVQTDLKRDFPQAEIAAAEAPMIGGLNISAETEFARRGPGPIVDLSQLPGSPHDALRRVLEAALGECRRI